MSFGLGLKSDTRFQFNGKKGLIYSQNVYSE